MSKFEKVRMADILFSAGYNKIKILDAIKYPKCKTIGLHSIQTNPPPNVVNLQLFSENVEIQKISLVDFGDKKELETPVYSGISYCDSNLDLTLDFLFGGRFNQRLFGHYKIIVPPPAEWPVPQFLSIEFDTKA